ncbi:MAG: amino acid ABC transporter substrate-binding protein [Oscillospiraceae bacterium]
MKKVLSLISAIAISVTMLAGCAAKPAETEQPAADANSLLGKDNVFVIGFDQNFPPFGYVGEDGEITGFDIELAKEVAKRLGWEIGLQPIDWDAKDLELESGTIDCIWNGFTMNGREDEYTWTVPYYDNSQVFIVKADSGISEFSGLAGKTVAVQKDSSALAALNGEENTELLGSFGELIEVSEYNTAFMDLEQGAVDAVALDAGVAAFQMEGRETEFTVLKQEISKEQYAIGFLLGNTEAKDAVEQELLKMADDGTVEKIAKEFVDTKNVCIIK